MDRIMTPAQRADEWLSRLPLFLDTETTGLHGEAELCEISILNIDGHPLIDTLLRPSDPLSADVTEIHGITNEMVQNVPAFPDIADQLRDILTGRLVIAYNASFDQRMVNQTCARYGLPPIECAWACAMRLYSDFCGNSRWQPLVRAATFCGVAYPDGLHRALADSRIMRDVVVFMARGRRKEVQNET